MTLRKTPIRRIGNRQNLFLGGDRELVMFSGLVSGALIFTGQEIKTTIFGLVLWLFALFVLRLMARHDPMLRHVFLRSRRYQKYYPPRSTPFRCNTRRQTGG